MSSRFLRNRLAPIARASSYRQISSSAPSWTSKSNQTRTDQQSSRKALLVQGAVGFAAGLVLAVSSSWLASNRSHSVGKKYSRRLDDWLTYDQPARQPFTADCESRLDDLIVNRTGNEGETLKRNTRIVNTLGDAHEPTRPKEFDDPSVRRFRLIRPGA
jgi:hypothetical protein